MTTLDVTILTQQMSEAGHRIVEGATLENTVVCKDLKVGICEAGMANGATSVMLAFTDPSTGKHYIAQTSAAIFETVAGAVSGAVLRFGK